MTVREIELSLVAFLELQRKLADRGAQKLRTDTHALDYRGEKLLLGGYIVVPELELTVQPTQWVNEHGQRFFRYPDRNPPRDVMERFAAPPHGADQFGAFNREPARPITPMTEAEFLQSVEGLGPVLGADAPDTITVERPFSDDVQR